MNEKISREEDLIYFSHIPKCGGISVFTALTEALGAERTVPIRNGPLYHFMTRTRMHHEELRHCFMNLRDKSVHDLRHALGLPNRSTRRAAFVHGHRPVYHAPRNRKVHVILTVRDPVDRLLSFYRYEHSLRKLPGASHRGLHKRLLLAPTFEDYATELLKRKESVPLNRQVLFLSRRGALSEALEFIRHHVFLAAPTQEIPRFLALMDRVLDCAVPRDRFRNEGPRGRSSSADIDPGLRNALYKAMADDKALADMVEAEFLRVADCAGVV